MRKIIIAFDGTNYPASALAFLSQLNQKNPVLAVGAFMPQTTLSSLWAYSGGSSSGHEFIPLVDEYAGDRIRENMRRFENFCIDNSMDFRVHRDFLDFTIQELKKESRFADLIIICTSTFYDEAKENAGVYLTETLHSLECPVLLVPENFTFPTNNVLTYDGRSSSVFAIKQFACLFPEFAANPTTLIYADSDFTEPIPEIINIQELASRHFEKLSLYKFPGDPKKFFNTWLMEIKDGIVVFGSFGGTFFHKLFHNSFSAETIGDRRLPVFIAHR